MATASVNVAEERSTPQIDLPAQEILPCNRNTFQPELGEAEANVNYTWRDADGVVISNAFEPSLFVGTYSLVAVNTRSECADSTSIEISQFAPPSLSINSENIADDCLEFRYQLQAETNATPLRYTWSDTSGTRISSSANLDISSAGTYYLEVFDTQTRCAATDSIVIAANENQAISGASIAVQQLDCLENTSGSIAVNAVQGGTSPFVYALDEAAFSSNTNFEELVPDTYQIRIEDTQGCEWDTLLTIDALALLEIELGENREVGMGEALTLEVMSNRNLQSFLWSNNNKDSLACPTCATQNLTPLQRQHLYCVCDG